MELLQAKDYLLFIDKGTEIKEGDIVVHNFGMSYEIEEPCDKDNLKSNTRYKIIAYRKLNSEAKELNLPELPPFEEVDIEKLALEEVIKISKEQFLPLGVLVYVGKGFIAGYKAAQQSKQFSLEDIINFTKWLDKEEIPYEDGSFIKYFNGQDNKVSIEWLFNKYLSSTQQLPKEFIPEFIDNGEEDWIGDDINGEPFWNEKLELKTITNSEGKVELVGTYKY